MWKNGERRNMQQNGDHWNEIASFRLWFIWCILLLCYVTCYIFFCQAPVHLMMGFCRFLIWFLIQLETISIILIYTYLGWCSTDGWVKSCNERPFGSRNDDICWSDKWTGLYSSSFSFSFFLFSFCIYMVPQHDHCPFQVLH